MKKWTMRDGTEIEFEDMTDSHLINAYKKFSQAPEPPSGFSGEMAEYFADCEWQNLCNSYEIRRDSLKKEAEKRGIRLV